MSNLNQAITCLETSWKSLVLRWDETKKVWNDAVRRDFEKQFWDVLVPQPPAVQREMERLMQVIAGARRNVK